MKKIIYMMRHGQTLFNQLGKIQGWCDSPLTELGIKQALGAKKYFEDNNITFDHAYCSTTERACDTLELVTDLPYKRLKGLKEMNFGRYEGSNEYLNPPTVMYDNFFQTFGGETRAEVRKRIFDTCNEIIKEDNQIILVVSHAGACSHFLWNIVSENECQEVRKVGFKNCCILKYEYENGIWKFIEIVHPEPIDKQKI